jgi:hypothetical protein
MSDLPALADLAMSSSAIHQPVPARDRQPSPPPLMLLACT